MPRKVKVLWVLSCVFIFVGFLYLSMQEQMAEGRKRKQERAVQIQKRAEEKKARLLEESKTKEMVLKVRELNALGQYREAADLAQKATERDPKNASAFMWWGVSLVKLGEHKKALEKFIHSSQLDPNQAKTYIYWGLTLEMMDKPEEAIDKYENALLLKSDDSNAYAYWGAALNKMKKHDEAVKKLQEALEYNPKNEIAFGVLVDAYFHKGEYKNAWSTVERARKAKVSIPEASLKRLTSASPQPQ